MTLRGLIEEVRALTEGESLWWALNHNGTKLTKRPLPLGKAAAELIKYETATGNVGSLRSAD